MNLQPPAPSGDSWTNEPSPAARLRASPAARRGTAECDLLQRMVNGDETALGELYDRWSPVLYPLIVHVVRDPDDAEEVLEETFWQAWRQAERYEQARGGVGPWLATMARSRALDRVRRSSRVREDSWDGAAPLPGAAGEARGPDPLLQAQAAEERRVVRGALERLPAEQREALELAYYGGLSQTEISERTGQPLGTVKTRIRLGMQKLKEGLAVLWEEGR